MCSSYYMYILQDRRRGRFITWCWMSMFWISSCNMWNTCTLRHVLYTRDYRRRRRLSDSVNCNMATFAGCVNGWIMEFKWGTTSSRIHGIYKFHSSFFFINHPRAILQQVEHRYIYVLHWRVCTEMVTFGLLFLLGKIFNPVKGTINNEKQTQLDLRKY